MTASNFLQNPSAYYLLGGIVIGAILVFLAFAFYCYNKTKGQNKNTKLLKSSFRNIKQNFDRSLKIAFRDALTNVPNRRAFRQMLDRVEVDFPKSVPEAHLILIEIDGLTNINENHGHKTGDELIQKFSQELIAYDSEEENTFRLSGNEFAKLCFCDSKLTKQKVEDEVYNILASLKKNPVYRGIQTHLGYSSLSEVAGKAREFFVLADQRLYEVKYRG